MTTPPRSLFSCILVACLLSSCRSVKPLVAVAPVDPVTAPIATPAIKTPVFAAGDILILDVFQEPTLSGEFVVLPDGHIRHPLLEHIWVKGLSPSVAEKLIDKQLRDGLLINPRVTVQLKTSSARKIVINGQVTRPGVYEFVTDENITLMGAVARAGGFTNIARPSHVRIVRSLNGEDLTIPVDVTELFSGKKPDIALQPGDKIFVPESPF